MSNGPQLFNILPRKLPGPPRWPFRVNRGSPQARGLKNWWPLVHAHGNSAIRDLVGNRNGTGPATANLPNFAKSVFGDDALRFTTSNSEGITMGDIPMPTTAATWSIWADIKSIAANHTFFSKWDSTVSVTFAFQITDTLGDGIFFIADSETDGGSNRMTAPNGTFAVDGPHLWTWRYDGGAGGGNAGRFKLFKDGIDLELTTFNGTIPTSLINSTGNFEIGSTGTLSRYMNAEMWDVRLHDVALSADEILGMFHNKYDLYEEYGQRTYLFPTHFPVVAAVAVGQPSLVTAPYMPA